MLCTCLGDRRGPAAGCSRRCRWASPRMTLCYPQELGTNPRGVKMSATSQKRHDGETEGTGGTSATQLPAHAHWPPPSAAPHRTQTPRDSPRWLVRRNRHSHFSLVHAQCSPQCPQEQNQHPHHVLGHPQTSLLLKPAGRPTASAGHHQGPQGPGSRAGSAGACLCWARGGHTGSHLTAG